MADIFTGLSGFPITPLLGNELNLDALKKIRACIDSSGLDSIGVLGSTGSFAYLTASQRATVFECWSEAKTPWIAGVSATSTKEALATCKIAQQNGASAVIANAFAYVPLTNNELSHYFLRIADASELPVCVYDNPITTGQKLTHDILAILAKHPNIKATKMFAKENNTEQHKALALLDWQAGYAVDANCCEAMIGGASAWYSTLAGTLPELLVPVVKAIKDGDITKARALNQANQPIYALMKQYTGYRAMHVFANIRGWQCELPSPLDLPIIEKAKELITEAISGH
ncbi:dihydrodipicolinate synthase family protein [Glaciecola sp. MH2013]|uniref:dihydrodipicolinate synthase family protein n=1 Tax=Glaciecola sp. MH2013 TaxID=2785524 RepID=UPI00189F0BA7|nr:dihydrodipicolinate synthase family protein [Glaciecola sp. MH2013]MBF7075068.1 dihydrodipicolinate synthase family protein [Glaciecola sp. MH2013]